VSYTLTSDLHFVTRDDGVILPTHDEGNDDCRAYLAWLAAGNAAAPVPPPAAPAVPLHVSNYQARAVLVQRGLFAKVDAAIRAADMTVAADMIALQAWDYANDFYRSSEIVAAMSGVLGLVPADVDAMFVAASQIL